MTSATTFRIYRIILTVCLAISAAWSATASQQYSSTYGYCVDFPEGFYLEAKNDDGTAYQFSSAVVPVSAIIRVYEKGRYATAQEALDKTLDALGADGTSESFGWRNGDAAVATFSVRISGTACEGAGVSADLAFDAGTIVLFSWCEESQADAAWNYMMSLLDSLCVDRGSFFGAGPITSYAYPESGEEVPVTLSIGGQEIHTALDGADKEASEYLIEREYDVLCLYQTSVLWKEAWQRYYRMIYRDSYGRVSDAAFDIYNVLSPGCADETELAQKLLTWTQGMAYEREATASDFASIPSILLGGGSDCDSRSMLLSVLLRHMNTDALMFVSAEYSHAIAGMVSSHPGHSYTVSGKQYLMGETTAQGLTWGKVAQDQDDESKWIPVEPPLSFGQ